LEANIHGLRHQVGEWTQMHWKQRPLSGHKKSATTDKSAVIIERQIRRERAIISTVEEARAAGAPSPTAEAIAEKYGLPVGLLRWMLPRIIAQLSD